MCFKSDAFDAIFIITCKQTNYYEIVDAICVLAGATVNVKCREKYEAMNLGTCKFPSKAMIEIEMHCFGLASEIFLALIRIW